MIKAEINERENRKKGGKNSVKSKGDSVKR